MDENERWNLVRRYVLFRDITIEDRYFMFFFSYFPKDMYCTYRIYLEEEKDATKTKTVSETSNPTFGHSKIFSFSPVTEQVRALHLSHICIHCLLCIFP